MVFFGRILYSKNLFQFHVPTNKAKTAHCQEESARQNRMVEIVIQEIFIFHFWGIPYNARSVCTVRRLFSLVAIMLCKGAESIFGQNSIVNINSLFIIKDLILEAMLKLETLFEEGHYSPRTQCMSWTYNRGWFPLIRFAILFNNDASFDSDVMVHAWSYSKSTRLDYSSQPN
jgi:hypothetical protein